MGNALAIVQSTGTEGQIVLAASYFSCLKKCGIIKPSHADSEDIYALTDIAVGKTSTSDSQQGNNPASAGNDGNNDTRWCANDDNTGHWWKVDLGQTTILSALKYIGNIISDINIKLRHQWIIQLGHNDR